MNKKFKIKEQIIYDHLASGEAIDTLYNLTAKEKSLLAHRYLYYVKNEPVITDYKYDELEKEVFENFPDDFFIKKPSSSFEKDYSEEIIRIANSFLISKRNLVD